MAPLTDSITTITSMSPNPAELTTLVGSSRETSLLPPVPAQLPTGTVTFYDGGDEMGVATVQSDG